MAKKKQAGKSKSRPESRPRQEPSSRAYEKASHEAMPRGRYVMGIHSAKEAIKVRPHAIDHVFLKLDFETNADLNSVYEWAKAKKIPVSKRPLPFFSRLCNTHQGLCLVVSERPKYDFNELKSEGKKIIVILDGIEDPHNLGAILRTAWLMGVKAIMVPKQKASPLTPTVIKVASGAAEHVPVIEESNLASTIGELKDIGFWSYGLSHKGSQSIWSEELPEKVVWVIGSEGKGIRLPVERATDILLQIPQQDPEASYNASVAAALALGETLRQHSQGSGLV